MNIYRITLYKKIEGHWHFCQLTAPVNQTVVAQTGRCGTTAVQLTETSLALSTDPQSALTQVGAHWRTKGYDYPKRHELTILSLQFKVPNWAGFPAGAPWFEDWKTFYQEPFEQVLLETVNGFSKGMQRSRGYWLLYYYVLDAAAARVAAEQVAAAASMNLPMQIHSGEREFYPETTLDQGVPGDLAGLLKNFEEMAHAVADATQNVVFHTVTLTPQLVHTSTRQRVKGQAARDMHRALREKWGFECQSWPPLGGEAKGEVVFVQHLSEEAAQQLQTLLLEKIKLPAYLLDCDDGIFEIEPRNILLGAYEGMAFDAGLDWVIYFSHHGTLTFGGEWLVSAVKELYVTQPEALNSGN